MPGPGSAPTVLVTRPAGQADSLCGRLEAAGFAVVRQPLLALEPFAGLPAAQRRLVQELDRFQHCIFISSNAVRFGLELLQRAWPRWPAGVACYAVGDSTAAALRDAGLSVRTPGADMTSEGLLALPALCAVTGQRVLIVKGEGGRQALRETLGSRGAEVEELACYRRVAPAVDGAALAERLQHDAVRLILISSGEALANLTALLKPRETHKLADITLVVPSARVAEDAVSAGWQQPVVAANAADDAMLAAAQRWRSALGESE
ncbi:uroporphyrinogen-III synthase [Pseudohaliea rubra]|uniref:Uroporphyrinogen-III synthase n=1 Tax=Pseudohaliea rubra DSM 19751 TaxID=1265313 RepID=A0A095WZH1_9GAMM|nr:uroporphyrinogen-III synthase [Pseudohaliea rubra]KGE04019.1 Uroporphyrinogen-III synthase [Pseudohaliea rubra DSM 19751]